MLNFLPKGSALNFYRHLVSRHPLELAALSKFSADIFTKKTPSQVATSILQHLGNLVPVKVSGVLIYNPSKKSFTSLAFQGLSRLEEARLKTGLVDDLVEFWTLKQKPLFIENVATSKYRQVLKEASSFMVLPFKIKGEVGSIVAGTKRPVKFDRFSKEILKIFSYQSALALNNALVCESLERETTERRKAERSLRKTNTNLETLVNRRTADLNKTNTSLRAEIEERKRVEEQLRKLSRVVEKTADSVIITDKNGTIEYVNRAFEKLTGYKAKEVIGGNPRILKSGQHSRVFYRNLWRTILSGQVFHGEFINKKKNGSLYWVERTISPLKGPGGEITHFVSTGRDITERKKAEEALRSSEAKYSTLVEKGDDGIIIIQDGYLKFVNPTISKVIGFSRKEAIGKPFTNFVAPEHRELVLARYKKRLAGKPVPKKYEIEILAKDNRKIPVEVNASLIEYEGRPADMAIIRDVTERKEAEKTLEEEKKKMETIFKSTKDGLALYDKDANVVSVNPSLIKLFGVKKNIIGVNRAEIANNRGRYFRYRMERSDNSIETHKQVLAGKTITNVFIKVYSRPIRYLEGTYVPIKGSLGKIVGMIASFRDVTPLKTQSDKLTRQLAEVERQKDRWEAVFGNVEEGVLILDRKCRIVAANAACELMSGCTGKEMVGKKHYSLFDCHDRYGHRYPEFDPISKVLATKETIPYDEHLHTNCNGTESWVGVSYTPILSKAGQVEQIVAVIRDITAIKQLEKAKSEFVSLASHELRTPLTVINGYLSLLLSGDLGSLSDVKGQENFKVVLDKVYRETNRLTKMVEELLNVSRIEDGRIKLTLKKVSMVEIIDEVVREFKVLAGTKNINLTVKYDSSVCDGDDCVMADKDKLKQILVNLIDNAIKYTDVEGRVVVRCFGKKGQIHTQVKDNGAGIPQAILPRIFEKFQQGSGGTYLKENKGTGLGLFVVKSLVELHKGRIWVDSKLGKGTKFTFTIPKVAAS